MSAQTRDFPNLRGIPKVDLHCHLNGSISAPLLHYLDLLRQRATTSSEVAVKAHALRDCSDTAAAMADVLRAVRSQDAAKSSIDTMEPAARMKHVFGVFDVIYQTMTNLSFTRLAVQDLLLHAAAEEVLVLEIRTSLRDGLYETATAAANAHPDAQISKAAYVRTITETVEHLLRGGVVDFGNGELHPLHAPVSEDWFGCLAELYGSLMTCEAPRGFWRRVGDFISHRMHIRLLISINRAHCPADAAEAVRLAIHTQTAQVTHFLTSVSPVPSGTTCAYREKARQTCWVTGIDFSGNCYSNAFADFLPALALARGAASLAITLHAGEKESATELAEMIRFAPERWGHLVYADRNARDVIAARHDPMELCMVSNTVSGGLEGVGRHQLGDIITAAHDAAKGVKGIEGIEDVTERKDANENDSHSALWCRLLSRAAVEAAMGCRLQRRLRRWRMETETPLNGTPIPSRTDLPNVSFHTDDRGVFATSVTVELGLLRQHAAFEGADAHSWRRAVRALQRLSLPHVFEMPLEIVLLCLHGAQEIQSADELTARIAAMQPEERAELSRIECEWLLEDFDKAEEACVGGDRISDQQK